MTRLLVTTSCLLALASPALAAEEGAANPFAGRIYQAIAAVIVFLTIFYILKTKAWGPILKGLQDREGKIKGDLEQAEKSANEAAETLKAYQQQLAQAQDEARRVIDQSKDEAAKIAARLKDEAAADIQRLRQRAEQDIEAAKESAMKDIYQRTADLATAVAGRILQREISPADQEQLVRDSLAELSNANRN